MFSFIKGNLTYIFLSLLMMLEFTFTLADRYLFSSGILKWRDKVCNKRLSFPVLKLSVFVEYHLCWSGRSNGCFGCSTVQLFKSCWSKMKLVKGKGSSVPAIPNFFPFLFCCPIITGSHQIQIHCSCYLCPYLFMKVKDVLAGSYAISSKSRKVDPSNPIQKSSKCLL